MSKIKRLPDAELEIMNALWDADAPLTAAELETALPGPPRARTTLQTLLARLEEKGCVTREAPGRVPARRKPQSVWSPFRRQPPQLCIRPCRIRHPHRRRLRRADGILGGTEKRKKIA